MKSFLIPLLIVLSVTALAFLNFSRCASASERVVLMLKELPDDPSLTNEDEIDAISRAWDEYRSVFSLCSRVDYVHSVSRGIVNLKAAQKAKEKDSFAMTKESLIYDLEQLSFSQSPSISAVIG